MDATVTHLIFFEGLPGSGKSVSAENLAQGLASTGHAVKMFNEMDPTNPLHTTAIDPQGAAFADIHLQFNIEGFAHQSLERYRDLSFSLRQNTTTIFESFPMQSHVRVLMQMDAPPSFIEKFWHDIQEALRPLAPALIFFEEADPESALKRILEHRGPQWAEYIVGALSQSPYAVSRSLSEVDGVIRMMSDYNALTLKLFSSWDLDKKMLPARPQDYARRDAAILDYFANW